MKQLINKLKLPAFLIMMLLIAPLSGFSQSAENAAFSDAQLQEILLWGVLAVELLLLLLVIAIYVALKVVVARTQTQLQTQLHAEESQEELVGRLVTKLNDAVPVEREEEILTAHEYDGIRELDNRLPPWWTALFYATIAFSVIYMVYYHVMDAGPLQIEEYQIQMARAEADLENLRAEKAEGGVTLVDENTVSLVTDEVTIAAAGKTFVQYCSACHGSAGEGGVGPNLTDNYWLHGGSVSDVFTVIKHGVPEKGMIAWDGQLSPDQMQGLASYILHSLVGTNPPNAKEPQGDLYETESNQAEPEKISMLK